MSTAPAEILSALLLVAVLAGAVMRPWGLPEAAVAVPAASVVVAAGAVSLDDAARRLGRPCARQERTGRVEREVLAAAEGAELLVLARDGDRGRPGPHSLGPASRFVVDHAPCPVLLVWPQAAPGITSVPPLSGE
ncbi:universal stress protein [Streptomyces beihaiensis]|uniref:Universal stress protein n=1 Tax=Streptomyces beihaiensis TaxID=2984495 RepID=A0ABT3TX99_9ACTN|nr:universal stress protein [Streptomyces beihaiensis]MCX3061649.1 universal stress protein [Streptomyces beihaiensis]